jgi:hypothetical protein
MTHPDRHHAHRNDLAWRGANHRTACQSHYHHCEPELQGSEIPEALAESSSPPGGERLHQATQRSQPEVFQVPKTENLLHVKEQIIKVVNRGERVEPFQYEVTRLEPGLCRHLRRITESPALICKSPVCDYASP